MNLNRYNKPTKYSQPVIIDSQRVNMVIRNDGLHNFVIVAGQRITVKWDRDAVIWKQV